MTGPNITIRGITYRDKHAAAEALGVSFYTVRNAEEYGTLDTVGLGAGRPGHPVFFDGKHYPSKTAAAKALRMCRKTLNARLSGHV